MPLLRDEALLLRRLPYSDTSLICHFFTRKGGRLGMMAKGARRKGSPLQALLQPGNLLELVYYSKDSRELQLLKEADLLEDWREDADSYAALLARAGICEILERSQQGEQPDEELFRTTRETLRRTGVDCPYPLNQIYWFLIYCLARGGYYLDLARCGACGRELRSFGTQGATLDRRAGQLHCPDCRDRDAGGLACSPRVLRVLAFLHSSEPEKIGQREITQATRRELGEMLESLLRTHMEHWRGLRCLDEAAEV